MTTPAPSSPVAPTKTDLDDTYPQAYDFGEDLGLSEKGQASVGPKTSEEILAIKRLARYVLRHFTVEAGYKGQATPYIESFNSVWLPSIVRSAIEPEPAKLQAVYLDVALWALDYDEATVAPRFVREQPELAMNFFSHAVLQLKGFAELINKASDKPASISSEHGGGKSFVSRCASLNKIALRLILHLDPNHRVVKARDKGPYTHQALPLGPLPPVPIDAGRAIRAACKVLDCETPCLLMGAAAPTHGVKQDFTLDELTRGRRMLIKARGEPQPWSHCQAQVGEEADVMLQRDSMCYVDLKGRKEWYACGRCKAVRYCAKDTFMCTTHMGDDHPRHDQVCWDPYW